MISCPALTICRIYRNVQVELRSLTERCIYHKSSPRQLKFISSAGFLRSLKNSHDESWR